MKTKIYVRYEKKDIFQSYTKEYKNYQEAKKAYDEKVNNPAPDDFSVAVEERNTEEHYYHILHFHFLRYEAKATSEKKRRLNLAKEMDAKYGHVTGPAFTALFDEAVEQLEKEAMKKEA